MYGASIDFSKSILTHGVRDHEAIGWTVMRSGEGFVHIKNEDVDESAGEEEEEPINRTRCWSMKIQPSEVPDEYRVIVL